MTVVYDAGVLVVAIETSVGSGPSTAPDSNRVSCR